MRYSYVFIKRACCWLKFQSSIQGGYILEAQMECAKREEVQVFGTRQVDTSDMQEANEEREKAL